MAPKLHWDQPQIDMFPWFGNASPKFVQYAYHERKPDVHKRSKTEPQNYLIAYLETRASNYTSCNAPSQ